MAKSGRRDHGVVWSETRPKVLIQIPSQTIFPGNMRETDFSILHDVTCNIMEQHFSKVSKKPVFVELTPPRLPEREALLVKMLSCAGFNAESLPLERASFRPILLESSYP